MLISKIKARVRDDKLTKLLYKLIKVGYVYPHNLIDSKLELSLGTPQGSIISPIMANIYFNSLDHFIEKEIIPQYNKEMGKSKKINEEYRNATNIWTKNPYENVMSILKTELKGVPVREIRAAIKTLRVKKAQDLGIKYYEDTEVRITYVRFADDYLIGVKGNKKTAIEILQRVLLFCEAELKMDAHPEKTSIRHRKKGVTYLGYNI